MIRTLVTTPARQTIVTNYLTNIVGTTAGTPRADLDMLIETICRKYGAYPVREPVRERDIVNSDLAFSEYFSDAFGNGKALAHEFTNILQAVGFIPRLHKITKHTYGSDDKTENETGTITDAGTHTATDTPVNTVTITPSGNKVVTTQGSSTGQNTGKLGAWDDNLYKGATQDDQTTSASSTETTTDGHTVTTTHAGKATDLSESSGNTRTLDTEKGIERDYSENEETNLDWNMRDLEEFLLMCPELDLYNWISREIAYDTCYTERGFYI